MFWAAAAPGLAISLLDRIADGDGVGAVLFDDAEADRRLAVQSRDAADVGEAFFGAADVADANRLPDRGAVARRNDEVFESFGVWASLRTRTLVSFGPLSMNPAA